MAHRGFQSGSMHGDADHQSDNTKVSRIQRPNRKQYTQSLADIGTAISKLFDLQKALVDKEGAEVAECKQIRMEKAAAFEKKKDLEVQLKAASQDIVNKSDGLAKLQVNLHYKNEVKVDEAIRRLEAQLGRCNFKLNEEKKIVAEIDSLKRSKSTLAEYNKLKDELDSLKLQQKGTRAAREEVFQHLSALKIKEDHILKERSESRVQGRSFQSELDTLFEKKRALKADFTERNKAHNEQKCQADLKFEEQQFEERRLIAEQRKKERTDLEFLREPLEKERHLCSLLTQYMQKFIVVDVDVTSDAKQANVASATVPHEPEGMRRLQRKGENVDDGFLSPVQRSAPKKDKRKQRQKMSKLLCHTPEAVSQFLELGICAPATTADVSTTLHRLAELKADYESAANMEMACRLSARVLAGTVAAPSGELLTVDAFLAGAAGFSAPSSQLDSTGGTTAGTYSQCFDEHPRMDELQEQFVPTIGAGLKTSTCAAASSPQTFDSGVSCPSLTEQLPEGVGTPSETSQDIDLPSVFASGLIPDHDEVPPTYISATTSTEECGKDVTRLLLLTLEPCDHRRGICCCPTDDMSRSTCRQAAVSHGVGCRQKHSSLYGNP